MNPTDIPATTVIDAQQWHHICTQLKALAQQEILQRFNHTDSRTKADGSLVTEADLAMQKKTAALLEAIAPNIGFLGEEMSEVQQLNQLNTKQAFWILDPLDGTNNFAKSIPFFSVSLALVQNQTITHGCVYDPVRNECFSAVMGEGAFLNDQRLDLSRQPALDDLKQCTAITDFKRLQPKLATALATQCPYSSQRSWGSVALDWCWMAAGRGQLYLHGRQKIWDYAAGWRILTEANGFSCNLDQKPVLDLTRLDQSVIAATHRHLFYQWSSWISVNQ